MRVAVICQIANGAGCGLKKIDVCNPMVKRVLNINPVILYLSLQKFM